MQSCSSDLPAAPFAGAVPGDLITDLTRAGFLGGDPYYELRWQEGADFVSASGVAAFFVEVGCTLADAGERFCVNGLGSRGIDGAIEFGGGGGRAIEGGEGIGEEGAARLGEGAVGAEETGPLGYAD